MSKYPDARIKGQSLRLTAAQLARDDDFLILKEQLLCPEDNCNARLVFTQRAGGYFSKHQLDSHSEECIYHEAQIEQRKSQEIIGAISRQIDPKHIRRKQNYAWTEFDKYLNPNEKGEEVSTRSERRNNRRTVSDSNDSQLIVNESPHIEGNLTEEEIPENARQRTMSYVYRRLDQISDKDSYKNLNVIAIVRSINIQKNHHIEITITLNNRKGKILFPEVYFKGNEGYNEEQLYSFWATLHTYLKTQDSKELFINFQCFSDKINIEDLKLSVTDPIHMDFKCNGKRGNINTIVQLIVTKVI